MTTYNIQSIYSPDILSEGVSMLSQSRHNTDRMRKRRLSTLNSQLSTQTSALLRMLVMVVLMIGWSSAWADFKDFYVQVNNQTGTLLTSEEQVQDTFFSFGVAVASNGTVSRIETSDASSVATVSGKYHSDHGATNLSVVVPVDGPVKITVGRCTYSGSTITVKNSQDETVASKENPTKDCWKDDNSRVSVINYTGGATTLTISGMDYCPYVSVERIFQDFELDFSSNPYTVSAPNTGLPSGVTIVGTFHDGQHGYNSFTADIPVPVGNYKITIGGCQYNTGTYNVSNGSTTLESIAQPYTCFDKNDKTKNIASKTYEITEKSTLHIDGPTYTPYFKIEKVEEVITQYTVTYSLGSSGATGTVPASVVYTGGDPALTIPKNFTLYKEGYTLIGWNDGTNTYAIGANYTPTADATLTPVFTQNTKTLADRTEATTIKWDFQQKNGAPSVSLEGTGMTGVWVTQATVAGEKIDVKLDYDATSGKINNSSWNDWCQMGSGTKFTIPSAKNAVVSLECNSFTTPATTTTTTIDGATDYTTTGQVVSKTISSETATIDVVIGDGEYFRYIQTVLPEIPTPLDVSSESSAQNTPEGWTAVQLPSITINKTVTCTLAAEGDNASTIQAAIDAVNVAGGGRVIIPAGTWLSGPLVMKSNVILHLNANCMLKMLPYNADANQGYPHTKTAYFIGTGDVSVENVVIEGEDNTSIIDGQGADWWNAYETDNSLVRPAAMIRFCKGSKFLVRNLKMQNAPQTNLTLGDSGAASDFTVHDVTIINPSSEDSEATADGFTCKSHNTDGIPVWGPRANIYKCNISTGDDNVVFDSNSQYGHVWDCDFGRGHGASIGSYTVNVSHILWDNIRFNGTESGFKVKSQRGRSGAVSDIVCRNSTMDKVMNILYLDCWYDKSTKPVPGSTDCDATSTDPTTDIPAWNGITFRNITATNCVYKSSDKNGFPIYFYGLPESHIKNVTLKDVSIAGQKGMFMAYAEGITFDNCNITNAKEANTHIATQYLAEWDGSYLTAEPTYPRTATWSFRNPIPQALQGWDIQDRNATHTLTSDIQMVQLEVDATADNAKFATKRRSDWAQFVNNAKFLVPVTSTSDVVTATTYSNGTCSVGGESNASGTTVTHTATAAEVINGYVEVVATANDYIGSVQVVQQTPVTPTFTDFKIDFRTDAYTVLTPAGGLPSGVTVSGNFHDNQHGYSNAVIKVPVLGPTRFTIGACYHTNKATVSIDGGTAIDIDTQSTSCDDSGISTYSKFVTYTYNGGPADLTFNLGNYCPYFFAEALQKDYSSNDEYDAVIAVNSVTQLKQALNNADGTNSKRFKIYLPNGTYDLGTDYNTMVNSYTTIVGESRDGVIIKNTPTTEGLNTSATLKTGSNVVLKDLTLQCTVDYNELTNAERGVALFDAGTNNAYQNIRLLGRQDVYYSDNSATSYFSDCEIHGTVDFICGGGSVWFERCTIKLVHRDSGTDVIAAPNNSADKQGYIFNKCTIDNADASKSMTGRYNLARAWQNAPKCAFYQTTYKVAKPETLWGEDMSSGLSKTFTEDSENAASGSPAISLPAAPANITISGNTLSWDAVTGASGYAIYRGTTLIATVGSGVTEYNISSASSAKALAMRKSGASSSDSYSVASISSEGVIGESAVAHTISTIKTIDGTTTTWDFTAITESMCADLSTGNWTNSSAGNYYKSSTSGGDETPAFLDGLTINTCGDDKSRVFYNGNGYCFNGGSAYIIIPVSEGQTLEVYSAQEIVSGTTGVTLSGADGVWSATIPSGVTSVKIQRNSGATYVTKIITKTESVPVDPNAYNNVAGTISWLVGNESEGTVSSAIGGAVSNSKVAVGTDLTASTAIFSSISDYTNTLSKYVPATSNPGCVAADMIEYTVKVKKGLTFTPTSVSFDAIKGGTDGAYFSWSYTVDGVESDITAYSVPKTQIRRDNNANPTAPITHNETISGATAGQTVTLRFYISNTANNKYMAIGNIKINGTVNGTIQERTFKDFELNFMNISTLPATPEGVTSMEGTCRNDDHGLDNFKMEVPVDGPVKITIGGCQYSGDKAVIKDGETVLAELDVATPGCYHNGGSVSWTYNSETATTLTIIGAQYTPYIKIEACEYIPTVDVTYYDTDGTTVIGKETVNGSSALAYMYGESDVTVAEGKRFRGWFSAAYTNAESYTGTKVAEGTALNADQNLYAVATPIETCAKGTTYNYDLRKANFYHEDHEGISLTNDGYNGTQHGRQLGSNGTIEIPVPGNSKITLGLCQFGNGGTTTVTSSNGGTISPASFDTKVTTDGTTQEITYTGPATTLTFTLGSGGYIHTVKVENEDLPASDLMIVNGKETIYVNPGTTYTLTKGVDYTASYTGGTYTYTIAPAELATVDENGVITGGASYGVGTLTLHHDDTETMAGKDVVFNLRVISAAGQTGKPTIAVNADGSVTVTKNAEETTSTFYYTLDGTEPTESSATTEGTIDATTVNGKVVKVMAVGTDKSPSDIVTAYVNVEGTFTWAWNEGSGTLNLTPTIAGGVEDAVDGNTKATVGSNLTAGWATVSDKAFATFNPTETTNSPQVSSAVQFNVIPLTGIKFKPTSVSFNSTRTSNTSAGSLDARVLFDQEYNLLTKVTPQGSWEEEKKYSSYPADIAFTTTISNIPASDEEFGLFLYIYNLANGKPCAFDDVVISGTFTGTEDVTATYYNISTMVLPETTVPCGTITHRPSASRVKEGKNVTFTATPAQGYKFVDWKVYEGTEALSNNKVYTVSNVHADLDLVATFEKLPKITFENNTSVLAGTVPEARYVNDDGTVKMPYGYLLYGKETKDKNLWSLVGWTDGETTYKVGQTYSFTEDVTLSAVIEKHTQQITDANTATTVRWNFDVKVDKDAAPKIESTSFIYTKQALVNVTDENGSDVTKAMDLEMQSAGAKYTSADERVNGLDGVGCQINDGNVLTIPAVPGMVVTLKASEKNDIGSNYTTTTVFTEDKTNNAHIRFDGTNEGNIVDEKTITYTYNGDGATMTINIVKAGSGHIFGFFEYLEVVYPILPAVKFDNQITSDPDLEKFPNEDKKNAGESEIMNGTLTPAHTNTGTRYVTGDKMTIKAIAGYGYKLTRFTCDNGTLGTATIAEGGASGSVEYTVGEVTGTVTAQYERLPMGKLRLESADPTLGDVDFASGHIHENFYTKGEGYVESYFVVRDNIVGICEAADDYVIDKWTKETLAGVDEIVSKNLQVIVTEADQLFFAHFKPGAKGSVTFDISHLVLVSGTTLSLPATPLQLDNTENALSKAPDNVTNSYSFTVPKYHTLFMTGYTLKFWVEWDKTNKTFIPDNTYQLGTNHSFTSDGQQLTLVPVFEKNKADRFNRLNEPIMLYEFGTGKGIRAQKVNLGKNTKTFYTTQVYVEAMENNTRYEDNRDVGLWVKTGDKGFVRNGDLPEWASFGPGTEFYIASCYDTKVEILSYAPMSTTTFGGKSFTLDEEKSDVDNHEYVYYCVTDKSDQRVPVVIGDDYSYYKYIKVYSKKADRVNLHVNVDDKARGEITNVEAINTADVVEPIIILEDGGHSLNQGNGVKVTFKRRFGFEFDKIVDPDKTDADGNPLAVLEKLDNGHIKMVKLGNGTETEEITVANSDGSWGSITEHVFLFKETESAMTSDSLRTQYEVSFNITTHRNLQIIFKEKPTYYVTYNAGQLATGIAPVAQWVEQGDAFTIPKNNTLYYEGNTLKYWVDSENNKYNIGQTCTLNKDWDTSETGVDYNLRLFPVFEKNTFNILDSDLPTAGLTATWEFTKNAGAPNIHFERTAGILITQLKKSETEWIDLKVDLDASDRKVGTETVKGKFYNLDAENPGRMQINANSYMTFPTTKNCEITINAQNKMSTTVIAGATAANGGYTEGKLPTVTYTGDEATQMVEFKSDGKYYTYFSVKYMPQIVDKPVLTSVTYGPTTLTSEQLNDLKTYRTLTIDVTVDPSTEIIPDVTGEASNSGKVTATKATVANPTSVITLKSANGTLIDTYTLKFTPKLPENAPAIEFLGFEINGQHYDNGAEVTNLPVSGVIKLKFNRTMDTYTIKSGAGLNTQYTALAGKTLEFSYWSLPVNLMSTFQVPSQLSPDKFKDIYGNEYSQTLSLRLTFSSTSMSIEHRTFDYIVSDGDLGKAIDAANAAEGTDRYYVFIPDGDYELKGNENVTIQNVTSDGTAPHDENGVSSKLGQTINNGMTAVTRKNVSLIGQSMDGVVIHNHPEVEGIGYTATIHTGKNAIDFYAEELSLRNDFDYWTCMNNGSNAARAVAFWDQGNRSILKNVSMKSWQDTYYSSNASSDYRAYWEDCTLGGIIDWACGDGNIWWERCDIQIRDRSGNNFAAPHTEPVQQWGYVFNNCRIMPEPNVTMEKLKGKDWTIARPWGSVDAVNPEKSQSPACTFLNTYFSILPKDAGWGSMGASMVLRFHEYNSMDGNGNKISLGARSLASANPAAGSDECILTDALKAQYTMENVLGGSDAFTPKSFTQQIDAASGAAADKDPNNSKVWNDNIETDDDLLKWNVEPMALCYFIFQKDNGKWKYITNVCQENDNDATMSFSLESLGSGMYCVRAANQRGGLGAATKVIEYVAADKIFVDVKEVEKDTDNKSIGWATICLPFNAKLKYVVDEKKDTVLVSDNPVKIYSAVSISDNTITLKKVDYLSANVGYVIYGTPGIYGFASSSHDAYDTSGYTYNHDSYLGGNPTADPVTAQNGSYYTLAYKPNISGIGFYKYTGSDLNPYKAYLSASTFLDLNESNKDESDIKSQAERRGIIFKFEDNDVVDIPALTTGDQRSTDVIYDLMGRRVKSPEKGRIYIINGQKIVFK